MRFVSVLEMDIISISSIAIFSMEIQVSMRTEVSRAIQLIFDLFEQAECI